MTKLVAVSEKCAEEVRTKDSTVAWLRKDVRLQRVVDECSTQRLRRSLDLLSLD
jgi:hypothetical protein